MIHSYNKPSELLARQKQTGESYWDMVGKPLPKYDTGKLEWYKPSRKVRKGIGSWEGAHFAGQNRQFGGDAIGAKAAELNNILNSYNLNPEIIPQGLYDALVSQYYNISPRTFKNYTGRYLQDYGEHPDQFHYKMLQDAIKERYKLANRKYQKGIQRRAAWEYDLVTPWEVWNGEKAAKKQEQHVIEAPVDATKVEKPQIVPEKIPHVDNTQQPVAYKPYKSDLPDIMTAYNAMVNGQMPLQILNNGDYGYDDYTEA